MMLELDGDVLQNREYACALSLDLSSRHIFYHLDLALPAISFGSFILPAQQPSTLDHDGRGLQ